MGQTRILLTATRKSTRAADASSHASRTRSSPPCCRPSSTHTDKMCGNWPLPSTTAGSRTRSSRSCRTRCSAAIRQAGLADAERRSRESLRAGLTPLRRLAQGERMALIPPPSGGTDARGGRGAAALLVCFLRRRLRSSCSTGFVPLFWNVCLSFQSWSPLHPRTGSAGTTTTRCCSTTTCSGSRFAQHAALHVVRAGRDRCSRSAIALLVNSDLRGAAVYRTIVFLSYPLMTVAVGDHLALDVRRARRVHQLRAARPRHRPPAAPVPAIFDWALPSRPCSPTSGRSSAST